MNISYSYNTQEASSLIIDRIYCLLESNHWSVKTLSDQSNIPYETLKKLLSRKTEHTSFHNIMKIALAFKCNLDYLVEPLENDDEFSLFQIDTQNRICRSFIKEEFIIPLFDPTNISEINSQTDTLNISKYPDYIKQSAEFGITISSYCYHPLYQPDEVLLISQKRFPHFGETCVFLHKGLLYIRTFYKNGYSIFLRSVNGIGPDIEIYDFSEWAFVGYVTGIHRNV